jgi:glycosyltransferase involved in cell wall biosynthesis
LTRETNLSTQLPPVVVVMLSTYNGAAFLREQLDSLVAQAGVAVRLHARDDGSTDDTVDILRSYVAIWPGLSDIRCGANLGAAMSFLELLRTAPTDAEFYAFCDQDDVWLPTKTARAVRALASLPAEVPALYCSNVACVDAALRPLGVPRGDADGSFQHLLFENIAYGCTIVMNASARHLIAERAPQQGVVMHDWWSVLIVAAFGCVLYDAEPRILYRQHGANSIGAQTCWAGQAWLHVRGLMRRRRNFYRIHEQASQLLRQYGDRLPVHCRARVERLVRSKRSIGTRFGFALSRDVRRSRPIDSLIARALLLAGWY